MKKSKQGIFSRQKCMTGSRNAAGFCAQNGMKKRLISA
jgi:hypothetical protein